MFFVIFAIAAVLIPSDYVPLEKIPVNQQVIFEGFSGQKLCSEEVDSKVKVWTCK
jgi:hypothetical protein